MRGIGVVGGRQSSPSFPILPHHSSGLRKPARSRLRRIPSKRSLLLLFAFLALAPPLFFHFRLRRFQQIKELDAGSQFPQDFLNQVVPTAKDALAFITSSVKQVILDAKVGPPLYEKDLARDIISIVKSTHCKNCLVWSKSDNLSRDVIELTQDVVVGYIVMSDPSTGARSKLLRMKGAEVVGVYHRLVDEKLVGILHREGKKVYAWTVDDAESMQRMLLEQVDAIITSNPQLLQRLMQDIKTECLQDGFP